MDQKQNWPRSEYNICCCNVLHSLVKDQQFIFIQGAGDGVCPEDFETIEGSSIAIPRGGITLKPGLKVLIGHTLVIVSNLLRVEIFKRLAHVGMERQCTKT